MTAATVFRYSATTPSGQTFTRESVRTYTHVVVARWATRRDREAQAYATGSEDTYVECGFAGSAELAQKLAATTAAARFATAADCARASRSRSRRVTHTGPLVYCDVLVLPLTLTTGA